MHTSDIPPPSRPPRHDRRAQLYSTNSTSAPQHLSTLLVCWAPRAHSSLSYCGQNRCMSWEMSQECAKNEVYCAPQQNTAGRGHSRLKWWSRPLLNLPRRPYHGPQSCEQPPRSRQGTGAAARKYTTCVSPVPVTPVHPPPTPPIPLPRPVGLARLSLSPPLPAHGAARRATFRWTIRHCCLGWCRGPNLSCRRQHRRRACNQPPDPSPRAAQTCMQSTRPSMCREHATGARLERDG